MANTVVPKYTTQIGPTVTPEVAGELSAWGEVMGVSAGSVARELIDDALPRLRRRWEREHGPIPEDVWVLHVTRARARGDAQIRRKRARDDRAREAVA